MGSYTIRMAKGRYRHHHFPRRIKLLFRFTAFVFFLFHILGGFQYSGGLLCNTIIGFDGCMLHKQQHRGRPEKNGKIQLLF